MQFQKLYEAILHLRRALKCFALKDDEAWEETVFQEVERAAKSVEG